MKKINLTKKYYKRMYLNIPEHLLLEFATKFCGIYVIDNTLHNTGMGPITKDTFFIFIQYNQSEKKKYEKNYIHYMHYETKSLNRGSGGANDITKRLLNWLTKHKIITLV